MSEAEKSLIKDAKRIGIEVDILVEFENKIYYRLKVDNELITIVSSLKQIEDIILVHKALQRKKKCS